MIRKKIPLRIPYYGPWSHIRRHFDNIDHIDGTSAVVLFIGESLIVCNYSLGVPVTPLQNTVEPSTKVLAHSKKSGVVLIESC